MTAIRTLSARRARVVPVHSAVGIAVAMAVAAVANVLVGRLAVAVGADPAFGPFGPAFTAGYSALGVLVGFLGWLTVRRWVPRPARALTVLVPGLTVLSFVPDLGFFDPAGETGAGPIAAAALMVMHVVVTAVAVPTYQRLAPVRRRPR